jgi:hypothetical protein
VLGESTISVNLGNASFTLAKPGPIEVHLMANYTSVDDNEKGTVVASAGGMVLESVRLDRSGHLDTKFTIPAEVAARNQGLELKIAYEPGPGACTPRTVPMSFQVDPASTATVIPGDSIAMGGFAALPEAFIPTFQVAMDGSDPDELAHAATLVGLIQQVSPVALRPILVSVDQASASNSSALIIADSKVVKRHNLNPPIGGSDSLTNIDVPADVTADIQSGLATVQSFAQNNRTILLVSASGGWEMAKPLFDYLTSLDGGWRSLNGDVLVTGQGANPQMLTIRADGPVPLDQHPGDSWRKWAWLSVAVLAVSAVVIGFLLLRRRSSKDIG